MRLPWKRTPSVDQFIVSWSGKTLCFVRARANAAGGFDVQQVGVEHQGNESLEDFAKRLSGLGLKGRATKVMLRPEQYQFLQIDTPAVAPEELRSAARYQIRELVNSHIDDITLDVMRVGDGQHKSHDHLFVVSVNNAVVRDVLALGELMKWDISVIDVQETAQRNLQTAVVRRNGDLARADAALVLADDQQALLTISVNEELFYSRRLELPQGFLAMAWANEQVQEASEGYTPVGEYVPDYSVGGTSYGTDYTAGAASSAAGGTEPAQRFLVEVQRSLDLWDRSWSALPLAGLRVAAGVRTGELARWLARDMGQTVVPMDVTDLFGQLDQASEEVQLECLPLLGVLMRTEARKL